jgi:hypothetical protein
MPQVDKNADNEMVALTVEYPGDRRFASDGLKPDNKDPAVPNRKARL